MDYSDKSVEFIKGHQATKVVKAIKSEISEQINLIEAGIKAFKAIFEDAYNENDFTDAISVINNISEHALNARQSAEDAIETLFKLQYGLDGPDSLQWYYKTFNGYCTAHDQPHERLWPNEPAMCELCYQEACEPKMMGWCSSCHGQADLVDGKNCRIHSEIYAHEINT